MARNQELLASVRRFVDRCLSSESIELELLNLDQICLDCLERIFSEINHLFAPDLDLIYALIYIDYAISE